ncbi:MAG: hypothetical protein GX362_03410 [Methanosarcinaceae archaeon]|mgnify:CR=1 FL=1|nr:hypothetical protein [Methanosarcinaceae archaeon]
MPENIMNNLNIPDNSIISGDTIKYDGMVILGNYVESLPGFSVSDFVSGESVTVSGEVSCSNDFRSDKWCHFKKNVTSKSDAYIGEYTTIDGKLVVFGDLDIGKDVKLNGGFESKGWLVVRNPIPMIMFLFLYIRTLIGLGKTSEEIDKVLEELFEDDENDNDGNDKNKKVGGIGNANGNIDKTNPDILKNVLIVPQGSKITEDAIIVSDTANFEENVDCKLSIYCKSFSSGPGLKVYGNIKAKESVKISENTFISGFINCSEKIIIPENCRIEGDVTAKAVQIDETSTVLGKIIAKDGVLIKKSDIHKTKRELDEAKKSQTQTATQEKQEKKDTKKPIESKSVMRYRKRDKTKFRSRRKNIQKK